MRSSGRATACQGRPCRVLREVRHVERDCVALSPRCVDGDGARRRGLRAAAALQLLRIDGDLCIDELSGHLTASTDVTPTSPITSNQAKHEQIVDGMTPPTPALTWKPLPATNAERRRAKRRRLDGFGSVSPSN